MAHDGTRLNASGGRRWFVLVFWLVVVAAVAFIGSSVTLPKIPTWYAGLTKPSFTPPNALFGPVWTVLYAMMAVAVWRIGAAAETAARKRTIALFVVQLALNSIWSLVFFGLESPKAALAVIVALLISLVTTLAAFWRIDRMAGLLLVPYLAWVCFATALNGAIVELN
jgi:benzodiazapine receptor